MNLLAMRTLLRRRLQEVTANQWQDSDLNSLLNIALGLIQTQVKKVRPDAFLERDTRSTEANEEFYEVPSGFQTLHSLEYKDSASGTYAKLRPISYDDTLNRTDVQPRYAWRGKYLVISPTPTAAVSAAIRIWYEPTLALSADTDIPSALLVLPLHICIVLWAQLLAVGERNTTSAPTQAMLEGILKDIPMWYSVNGDEPPTMDFDLGKDQLYYGGL